MLGFLETGTGKTLREARNAHPRGTDDTTAPTRAYCGARSPGSDGAVSAMRDTAPFVRTVRLRRQDVLLHGARSSYEAFTS